MQDKFCFFIAACLVHNINAGTVFKWHAGQQEPAWSRDLPRKWLLSRSLLSSGAWKRRGLKGKAQQHEACTGRNAGEGMVTKSCLCTNSCCFRLPSVWAHLYTHNSKDDVSSLCTTSCCGWHLTITFCTASLFSAAEFQNSLQLPGAHR